MHRHVQVSSTLIHAYLDESCSPRPAGLQEYLVCAVVLEECDAQSARESLRPLLRPGQRKLHWTDESSSSRNRIINVLASLEQMSAVVSHVGVRRSKTERFRRKCLAWVFHR
jgi:hypothetical protein